MKKNLTYILIVLSILIVLFGNMLDIYWIGIATWGIATILLGFAIYFTKYIINK